MALKYRYGKFRKCDFVSIIKQTRDYVCANFGYKRKPPIFETKLPQDVFMAFLHRGNRCAIYYDYQLFKKSFARFSFDLQQAYASSIMAHEIRHYHQYRQINAKKPTEPADRVELWRKDQQNYQVNLPSDQSNKDYLQPIELDATLFEYVFGAEEFGRVLIYSLADLEHLDALEKLHVDYFGKTDEQLFGDKIKNLLKGDYDKQKGESNE